VYSSDVKSAIISPFLLEVLCIKAIVAIVIVFSCCENDFSLGLRAWRMSVVL
jgi:hypothetical protein